MEIKVNDYIIGYENVGTFNYPIIKVLRGWVDDIVLNENKEVIGYSVQADDQWNGHRGTYIMLEYGVVNKLDSRPRPFEVKEERMR